MSHFQTPPGIAQFMSVLVPPFSTTILEPTPGDGNLVKALRGGKRRITAPQEFFSMKKRQFDCIVMNPPFTPMALGYKILFECMEMSDNIIALMPWLTIINSQARAKKIMDFGVVNIFHLPRSVFPGSRVQTCILEMDKGYRGETKFSLYE